MADIIITPANVVRGSNAVTDSGIAGATILAGQAVYLDSTVNKYLLADADSATVEARKGTAIALHGASLNQPLAVQKSGDITIGATLVAGTDYWLSGTAGGICPRADIGTGEYVGLIGIAKSTTVLSVCFQFPNVAL